MSGVAKFVGTVAGVVSIVATIAGNPVVAGIAAGVAAAANVTAQVTAQKPPAQTGAVNKITIGANQPRPYLIGETYYGGNRIHHEGFGGKTGGVNNPYMVLIDVYSGAGPVEGFVGAYLDFVQVPLSGNAATGYAANHLYVYRQLGQIPEPQALSTHWGGAQGWTAQHKLSSYAAISWCLRFDEDGRRFAAGTPQTGAVWRGVKCYDPRKDSTYPGGSGPHRWADPSDTPAFDAARATWEYTRSPGLHGLRYALGTWERNPQAAGTTYRKTFGIGMPIDGIRVADFVALANVCDANGWHVDGVISEPGNRDENLKNILAAGGAERCWVGGKLGLKLSAPGVALDRITEYDLATDDVEVGAMQGWESRVNTIIPKFRSPTHKWEYVPSAPVAVESYLTEDGEEKAEERQFNLVQDRNQAAQLAAYELVDARELGEIVITCKPRLRRYGAGDMLTVHLPDDGLVEQQCVVLKRTIDPVRMTVEMVLRGETPAKHDFALGRTGTAPPTPTLVAGDVLDDVAIDAPVSWEAIVGDGKPADGATVGAPIGTIVHDRPAEEVTRLADLNGLNIFGQILRGDALAALIDARTVLDGKPVGTVLTEAKTEFSDGISAVVQTIDLMGVKNAAGTGFVYNSSSAVADENGLVLTTLGGMQAEVAGHTADITDLKEVLYDPSGVTLRSVNILDLDGNITGTVNTLTGEVSSYTIYATMFQIVNPNGGQPFTPFQIGDDGTVEMISVRVKTLAYEALVPLFAGENNQLDPNSGFQVLPGGLIVQWGRIRAPISSEVIFSVTFPKPFPGGVMSVGATPYLNSFSISRDLWVQNVGVPSVNGATFGTQAADANAQALDGIDWFAFGY